jgi:hypothetical protein
MRPPAEVVWCGVSAPVVQGLFVGLGIAAVGLMAFPFGFTLMRPPGGKLADFGSAAELIKWGRRLAWLVGSLTVITLAGYVALYSATSGRFCTARLNHREQTGVIIWAWVAALTFVVLAISAILRARARKLGGNPGGGGR